MNKPGSGYTLIEMLIVVAIIAVLSGVGFSYYSDSIEEARINTVKMNMRTVKDALARYFKDRMVYPTSLDELRGPYLQQSVQELILNPILPSDGNAKIEVQVPPNVGDNAYHIAEANMTWVESSLSTGKQIKNIRVNLSGIYLY
ncbi:MAG: prepilin-type N-terminal cleavage/methylation domain-containing protein [Candidatus Riflebacteria bacterium]